jgi:flagellar motility protein MotE (MotC chaperone)
MKKMLNVVVLTLAMNFLIVAGAVGWLYQSKHLDRERVSAIKEILFPKALEAEATTQPSDPDQATTQPILRLEELLARQSGRSASEQVEFIRHAFDTQSAQLERRAREISDLQRQVELAKQQYSRDHETLQKQRKQLADEQQEAEKLAGDKGFQDSLALYNSMPPKQVKSIFMSLDEQTVVNYMQAMQPRTAAKIIKEFKAPEETARIQKILEKIRQAQANAASTAGATAAPSKE